MFLPRPFNEPDPTVAVAMVRSAGFGHLVVAGDSGPVSTPLPCLVDDALTEVRGHLARPNPMVSHLPNEALLIVPVSDTYVSPSWYASKAEHGRVVPTWNYEVVHLHGRLVARDDDWTEQLVRDLTDHHEARMPEPWSVDDAPPDYITKMLRGIVGVSLSVTRIEAKRKLSQNRPEADVAGTVAGLQSTRGRGADDVARAMRSR